MRILLEDSLAEFPTTQVSISTPCAPHVNGLHPLSPDCICAVSIVRSGDALLDIVRAIEPGVRVGKILIQRNEALPEKPAELFYSKFPKDIANMHVLLCDPMLATGGSAMKAIQTLVEHGVNPSNIVFANMICAPEGLKIMAETYPMVKIVTVCVDESLNEDKYIVPGLGDYGDRYFNT
jgi:uracil phosphoribosyltransferase